MPPKEKKAKAKILAAATSGGKIKKKKWSRGKHKEKLQRKIFFPPEAYEKFIAEVPKWKLITLNNVAEQFSVKLSLAKLGLRELEEKKLIHRLASSNHAQLIYRGTVEK